MTIDWNKARELCERATRGPWKFDGYDVYQLTDSGQGFPLDRYPDSADIITPQCEGCGKRIPLRDENAEFIAAARTLLPEAIERIARLEAIAREAIAIGSDAVADSQVLPSKDSKRLAALLEEVNRG